MGDDPRDFRNQVARLLSIIGLALVMGSAMALPFTSGSARAANVAISIVDFSFIPTPETVAVGDIVTWTNNGANTHTVTSIPSGPLDSGSILPGGTYTWQFNTTGTYDYHCSIHTFMTGTINVVTNVPEFSSVTFVVMGLMVMFIGLVAVHRRQ